MSIIKEEDVSFDDGPESGQCSEDEFECLMQKKSKRHKKRSKANKSRKRKHSSSTSGSTKTEIDFFNPYSVNTERYFCKPECVESFAPDNFDNQDLFNDQENIINVDYNDLSRNKDNRPSIDEVQFNDDMSSRKSFDSHLVNRRKALYMFDKFGIESNEADLRYMLLDFGFSNALVADIYSVLYHAPSPEPEEKSSHDEEEMEENEEEMYNDLPIIDTSRLDSHDDLYANSYSPEPVSNIVEPYKIDQNLSISYAPKPLSEIFDPHAIPEVGPKDPRLNQNKPLVPKLSNSIPKIPVPVPTPVVDNTVDKFVPKPVESNLVINKDWEVTVANTVKTHLRLYLVHNDINKEEYKSILRRAVNKIISSGEKKLETDKISKFLHSYVIMMQKSRYVDGI